MDDCNRIPKDLTRQVQLNQGEKSRYGKITVLMETKTGQVTITPPKLIASLSEGFNIVASRFYLIIMPIVLDLFLWLGPRLSFQATVIDLFKQLNSSLSLYPDMADLTGILTNLEATAQNLNFFSILRGIPLGVPSLMAFTSDAGSPLPGISLINTGNSYVTIFLLVIGLGLAGIFLGSIYFSLIAHATQEEKEPLPITVFFKHFLQGLLLTLAIFVILLFLSIPVSFFANIIAVIAPGIYGIAIYVVIMFIIWLLLPIVFSAHGIYLHNRSVLKSITISFRFVRSNMSGTGIFVLSAVLINMGLNILWKSPSAASWMKAIGIFGHSFIFTALVATSFIYYRNGLKWMKEKLRRTAAHSKDPRIN